MGKTTSPSRTVLKAAEQAIEESGLRRRSSGRVAEERGKVLTEEMLQKPSLARIIKDSSTANKLDPRALGVSSHAELVQVLGEALQALRTRSNQSRITVSNWIGEVFEILGSRQEVVVALRRDITSQVLTAARTAGQTFLDGFGNPSSRTRPFLAANVLEVSDLRLRKPGEQIGAKYCDRASLCINEAGEVLLVLTEEYKTAGVKTAERDAQQAKRNARIMEQDLPSDTVLTFIGKDGEPLEMMLSDLRVHVENPGNQIGVQAGRRESIGLRSPERVFGVVADDVPGKGSKPGAKGSNTAADKNAANSYTEIYYLQRVKWPGRELRTVMEVTLASLPAAP